MVHAFPRALPYPVDFGECYFRRSLPKVLPRLFIQSLFAIK
uniref:Uncharacterized protein n=1 Tax=Staphylococcus arlettae TaxID=29378 RepID=A0A1W5QE00_9STAP|nr:hypothetical protein [Staphylococcus arlettae]